MEILEICAVFGYQYACLTLRRTFAASAFVYILQYCHIGMYFFGILVFWDRVSILLVQYGCLTVTLSSNVSAYIATLPADLEQWVLLHNVISIFI